MLQNQKRVAKGNRKIIMRHRKKFFLCHSSFSFSLNIMKSVKRSFFFFKDNLTSFFFFASHFGCYMHVFFHQRKKSLHEKRREDLKKKKNLVPSGQSINLSMFQQNRVWPVLDQKIKLKTKKRLIIWRWNEKCDRVTFQFLACAPYFMKLFFSGGQNALW